ncbi:MAG: exodeoxyribonuclease V subunit alpha [Burkholderiales bacterium]|nr:exodeoxyribonuclease V subunit alpha [Burkholderiales bacterium]
MNGDQVTVPQLLHEMQAAVAAGRLRPLALAWARFAVELDPMADAALLLAVALLVHGEASGHSCLDLDVDDADAAAIEWSAEARARLGALRWADPQRLAASPLVGRPADGPEPLVLAGSRLYLRRHWRHEHDIAAAVRSRVERQDSVEATALRPWLDRLFPDCDVFDWQKAACAVALRSGLTVITGGPGTGKTYTAARLLALLYATDLEPTRLRVALAAPTGKAAARLGLALGAALDELRSGLGDALPWREIATRVGVARTLHALLGARPDTRRYARDERHPLEVDLLIVDEASMIHLEMMAALLRALPPRSRLVLLGDKDQLASVEAGSVLGDLCSGAERGRYRGATAAWIEQSTGRAPPVGEVDEAGPALAQQTVMLRHSRRFGGPIGTLALAVRAGDAHAAEALLEADTGPEVRWLQGHDPGIVARLALRGRDGAPGGYAEYLRRLRARPESDADVVALLREFDRFRLLCAVRDGPWGVAGVNDAVERALADAHHLHRTGPWYEGRPVMVTRNDPSNGISNGDVGVALRPPGAEGMLRVCFAEGEGYRAVGVNRLAQVETAYAMTVHKSQGSEFEHTVLVLPGDASPVLTRELVYTGVTRSRSAFTLVTPRRAALAEALARPTRRSSGLAAELGCVPADGKAN